MKYIKYETKKCLIFNLITLGFQASGVKGDRLIASCVGLDVGLLVGDVGFDDGCDDGCDDGAVLS